jgi:hypothetical protein
MNTLDRCIIVHDIVPNIRCLHRIPLKANDQGKLCVNTDTLLYRAATCRAVFLNRRAAARYRALASIIPGRENLSF